MNDLLKKITRQRVLLFMALPFVIHLIIFRYIPIVGWVMAFQDYKPARGLFAQKWVGFEQFRILFSDLAFYRILRNTLAMAAIKLVLGTVFSILVAVLVNETRSKFARRSVQTISYLPHFVSWVVAANIFLNVLSPDSGILNNILMAFGIIKEPVLWLGVPEYFWHIIGWSHVWKECGFGAIIYLSAMTAIDPQIYEAADIDGARRLQRIRYITLPGIKATFIILLIMNIGHLLDAGFEQQYLLQNGLVQDYSEVFTIYIMKYGLKMMRYSYAAAAGIFKSVVSIILIFSANRLAARLGEETLV
ncbi:MAG: sugar ABC transporter permease [Spirochaetales bacterium]|nr:sugar ABC transporter permease [Spirochaetales bacterium]